MSDLAFARPFDSLADPQLDRKIDLIQAGMNVLGVVSPTPWLAQLLFSFPGMSYSWTRMIKWASSYMEERIQVTNPLYI